MATIGLRDLYRAPITIEMCIRDSAERYRNAYDYLKCALSLTADYTEESEGK